ncbi:MAG: hypothetical protein AMXMBFR12_00350 [Candidatus Babeliales bacterium]
MQETWTRWEPITRLSHNYYCESLIDTPDDGFQIRLFDEEGKKLLISFSESVDAYRSTDGSFSYDTIESLEKKYGKEFYSTWSFFKIENSEFLEWIKKESQGTFEIYQLQHFCFWTIDCRIDVINNYDPEIKHI